ncbi:Avirulence (Avh) protein [Phytophthora megakarya]|uniref:Avirulence (Avh) protein n=1 Tax=Phytophthora megakarya TaxID=4795 RepID=A0A225WWP2_9STRA|nr:Avirulence (Avh) protein [Phytophthora megakarya]
MLITDSKVLQSDFSERTQSQVVSDSDVSVIRLLRSNSAADKELTEERAGGLSVSGFERFKSVFKSSKIPSEKLQKWLESGKSADVVFTRFRLHKRRNPFNAPQFAAWVQYADELSAKLPEMSAISTLTRQYGDDALFRMIKVAKMDTHTNTLAIELETKQMQHWVAIRKDPDEVFQLFTLSPWTNMFETPEFTTWVKYVEDLNTKHPENPAWMSSTLTKYYNDETLFKIIDRLKRSGKSKAIAAKMENDWIQAGVQNHKPPYQVLLDLGLGKKTDNILEQLSSEQPLHIRTWVQYIEVFNRRYPEEKTSVIESLTKIFDDVGVTTMLNIAKDWDITTNLRSAQLRMWLDSGKSTDDVFKLLKLDQEENIYSFRDKALLNSWVSYINVFVKEHPDQTSTLFAAMEARLKDKPLNELLNVAKKFRSMEDTATKIQTKKIQSYLASKESPRNVFSLLGLVDEGNDLLGSPLFQRWMKYVEDFNKRYPNQQESWFDTLRIEIQLGGVRMIGKAIHNPSTVDIGKRVEREWLNFWLDSKIPPKEVFHFLFPDNGVGNYPLLRQQPLADRKFKTWATYLDEFNKRYPNEETLMIDVLRSNFNDISLLEIFKTAMNNPSTKMLVSNLENELISKWLVEKKTRAYLYYHLGHVESSKEIIERYIKRVTPGNTT